MRHLFGWKGLITTLVVSSASMGYSQQASPTADTHLNSATSKPRPVPLIIPDATSTVTTTGGTNGYLPRFSGTSTVVNSLLFDAGTGVGIGNKPNPSAMLDVNGAMIVRGRTIVSRTGNATPSTAYPSYSFDFFSNIYNSSTKTVDNAYYALQSEPTGNNTSSPSATFNLRFANNGGAEVETGFYINPNGAIHFSPAQTFPIASGPQGPPGPTGPQGPAGPQGPPGSGGLTLPFAGTANGAGNYLFKLTDTDTTGGGAILAVGGSSNDANVVPKAGISGYGGNSTGTQGTQAGDGVYGRGGDGVGSLTYGSTGGYFVGGSVVTGGNGAGTALQAIGGSGVDPGTGGDGLYASVGQNGVHAAYFNGNVQVSGNLSKSGGSFKIDDPIDPENKYLSHSFVESPDMKNMYDGVVVTDNSGSAIVELPAWFEALNRDFRYQLTVVGQFAQAIVSAKVANNRFAIRTDKPGVEVSWQVTGIRQDAWANAHRIPTEEEKTGEARGRYIHPELFGKAGEQSIEEARHRALPVPAGGVNP